MFNKNYGVMVIAIIFFFFQLYIPFVHASETEESKLQELQRLSQIFYEKVKIKEYAAAKGELVKLSLLFPTISYKGLTTTEGIEAISAVIIHSKKELAAISPNEKSILYSATQLYLAIDALTHPLQPYWHRYYSVINKDLNTIEQKIKSKDAKQIEVAYTHFQNDYLLIRPAIIVVKPPYVVERTDSLIKALVSQQVDQNKEILLNQLRTNINQLFYGDGKETWVNYMGENTIWRTSVGMGITIFIALSYVIWRKFKGVRYST
ncbi:sporulation protein YpjB [Tepidibacillus sp. HK-1]|uniref:sporulation protein YpjB n=1 Tax=Tepidibacillus sp. HK-1 TaxID=1883407 RepID=UPI000852B206|nr:sporulation protein YpjB [Tepidibacillus sp. HK-1]GBF11715.1 sporulation protein YpjB [Tepidibacillus sp. HK-1]